MSFLTVTPISSNASLDLSLFQIYFADDTSGSITITLPDIELYDGVTVMFKKINSSANTVTLAVYGSQNFYDNASSKVLSAQNSCMTICSLTGKWHIINNGVF